MKPIKFSAKSLELKQYLYAVRMLIPGHRFDPIKIGVTTNPKQRRSQLSCGPFPIEWIGHWPGNGSDERHFHSRYGHLRLEGEWFEPCVEMLDEINRCIGVDYPRRAPGFYLRARQDRALSVLAESDAVAMKAVM